MRAELAGYQTRIAQQDEEISNLRRYAHRSTVSENTRCSRLYCFWLDRELQNATSMSTEQLGPIQEVLGAWQEQARLTQHELTKVTEQLEFSRSENDALLARNARVSTISTRWRLRDIGFDNCSPPQCSAAS